jgi:hypothetical protein
VNVGSAVRVQRQSRLRRHAEPGGDERLHHRNVVAARGDPRGEARPLAHRDQLLSATLADGLEALEETFDIEATSSPGGVTHLTFTAKGR